MSEYKRMVGESSLRNARVSPAHFVDVRLRPRRNRHRAGAQARQAKGEALGTASAEATVKPEIN